MSTDGQVIDISTLPRPAAGTSVELPSSGMARPEVAEELEVSDEAREGPSVARADGTYDSDVEPYVFKPSRTKAKLQDHQKHAIAQAIVSGIPMAEIAVMVRHTPQYVKRQVEEDKGIQNLIDHYSSLLMRVAVSHRFEMLDRMPQAYAVLDSALIDKDARVQMTAMDKVFAYSTLGVQDDKPSVEINIGNDPAAYKAITDTLSGVHDLLKGMQSGELEVEPIGKHLHEGLPGPEAVKGHVPRRS